VFLWENCHFLFTLLLQKLRLKLARILSGGFMRTKKYNSNTLNYTNTAFLLLSPVIALAGTAYWLVEDGFSYRILALAIIFYIITAMGITAGYHRLFSHRAYKASTWYKILMLIAGGSAVQNSALKWCNDHRIHHGKVDTPQDPYNINEGFFYAHMGWVLLSENISDYKASKDLLNDKWVMLQHKYYVPMIIIFSFLLPTIIGHFWAGSALGGLFFAGFFRIVFVHHMTFFINSLCHVLGKQPYDRHQTAKDSWFMAILTMGEGYHNYHHCFQSDYRNGIRWYHFDPTKWLIKGLNYFGVTYDLKKVSDDKIIEKLIQAQLERSKEDNLKAQLINEFNQLVNKFKSEHNLNENDYINALKEILERCKGLTALPALA
jgi:stearoyl-CoA desaturase (delta-9 desaturase)